MDLIADALTKVRNAIQARHTRVNVRYSKVIGKIAEIMQKEGYIRKFQVLADGDKKEIRLFLRTNPQYGYAIRDCQRVSRGSRRVYRGYKDLPDVKSGLGTCIVSTSKGVMTVEEARKDHIGGEVLCTLF